MIDFKKFELSNGLRVIVHEDHTIPMAVLNILYDVGARDEDPEKTGFAHLFEHLMFGGSVNIPVYDEPLQRVGGENNAFTTNDITNYYIQVPSVNLQTAFWLESDRMLSLAFSEKSLDVQRNVVIEEFKQRYLNQPYGNVWLKLRPLVYKVHPYRWATIGKEISHIEEAKIEDVKAFFNKHYNPSNAIMVVAGDVDYDQVVKLSEKWFGTISPGEKYTRDLPQEPEQHEERKEVVKSNVPSDAIYKVFHIHSRKDHEYYVSDIISDMLSRGESSRLYQSLVKEKRLFSDINAYISGDIDNGIFVIEGKLSESVTMEAADQAIWDELSKVTNEKIPQRELDKILNKLESSNVFGEMNLLNKAMNLAYYELLGDADLVNKEMDQYRKVTPEDIRNYAGLVFRPSNCSTLYYYSEN
jgi:zinc protease